MRTRLTVAALTLAAAGACVEETPGQPTWIEDVEPIMAANCARCHGAPPFGGAPGSFRLDVYDDPEVNGAAALAERIAERAGVEASMPPAGSPPLTDRQREILIRWDELGAPLGD